MRKFVLLCCVLAAPAPAYAQTDIDSREGIALQNQILELRQEIAQMQTPGNGQAPASTYTPPPAAGAAPGQPDEVSAQLVVRVSQLEDQVRELSGRVEDLTNQLQKQHDEFAKQIGDINFKLNPTGADPAALNGATPPDPGAPEASAQPGAAAPASPALATVAPKRSADAAMRAGNAALAKHDYPGAQAAAREVLALGHGPRTSDAEYLLAQSDYGLHRYKLSATEYFDVYNRAPGTGRAASALLGTANAMIGLGQNANACEALAKLYADFPRPPADVKLGAAGARKRAACH